MHILFQNCWIYIIYVYIHKIPTIPPEFVVESWTKSNQKLRTTNLSAVKKGTNQQLQK